eukprot:3763262-Rhodomonas_salina.1
MGYLKEDEEDRTHAIFEKKVNSWQQQKHCQDWRVHHTHTHMHMHTHTHRRQSTHTQRRLGGRVSVEQQLGQNWTSHRREGVGGDP